MQSEVCVSVCMGNGNERVLIIIPVYLYNILTIFACSLFSDINTTLSSKGVYKSNNSDI